MTKIRHAVAIQDARSRHRKAPRTSNFTTGMRAAHSRRAASGGFTPLAHPGSGCSMSERTGRNEYVSTRIEIGGVPPDQVERP
jgi:hypothetical protein